MLTSDFHFIRPYWFIAILPVAFILWKLAKQHLINKHWESVCDPELLPYILIGKSGSKRHTDIILTSIVTLLMIVALAGPSWERLPQPVFQKESALVIALDLSLSMYADDIQPSRLERARFKISDLLNLRKEGQTALLVYAGDAFTVTPLTDDVKTINSQLSALSPAIMPAPGSRTDTAITKAIELLKQAGTRQGHILLVTDEVDAKYENNFIQANKEGFSISILGVGTDEGAPVSLGDSGFLEDRTGTIVIPKLDEKVLKKLASVGGGYYETSQIADGDIERLNRLFNSGLDSKLNSTEETKTDFKSDQWHEFGPWLVLFIIPVVAFGFRRGYLAILVCIMVAGNPDDAMAFEWNDLWLNKNQKAMRALENEQADVASDLFQDNEWKAAAKYRSGDYAATEKLLNDLQDNRSLYNKANSLARQGRYEDAIKTYKQVLENDPHNEDAKFNKEIVEKELDKQQQQQSQSDQNRNQNKDQDSKENKENQAKQDQQQSQSENKQQQSDSESEQQQSESNSQQQQQQQQQHKSEEKENSEHAEQKQADDKNKQQEQKMKQQQEEEKNKEEQQKQQQSQQAINELDEDQQAAEQWLRRIPDDPSGLLRRKFKYQYQQQNRQSSTSEKYW